MYYFQIASFFFYHLYPFIVTFTILKHLMNKLVAVMIYILAAIKSNSLTTLLSPHEVNITIKSRLIARNRKALLPEDFPLAGNVKEQLKS